MIDPATRRLLERFAKIELLEKHKAVLIGGTAIAYYLNHRKSYDIDICFPFAQTLPKMEFLREFEEVIPLRFERSVVDEFADQGGDLDAMVQRYMIDGIKVDFTVNPLANIYESRILKEDIYHSYGTLKIASIETLFRIKALLLLDRNKIRDLYDVVYMMEKCGYGKEDFFKAILQSRITQRYHTAYRSERRRPF